MSPENRPHVSERNKTRHLLLVSLALTGLKKLHRAGESSHLGVTGLDWNPASAQLNEKFTSLQCLGVEGNHRVSKQSLSVFVSLVSLVTWPGLVHALGGGFHCPRDDNRSFGDGSLPCQRRPLVTHTVIYSQRLLAHPLSDLGTLKLFLGGAAFLGSQILAVRFASLDLKITY
ncbi:hypothetical protein RRG08_049933 [Elysia crispata]|uniref:Uncharacterized protein n=1 Tax=Elysia crispata TaxID=231223 RepID=A0AAE0XZD7_9GAST|nr:hypothetical protein RRG08_049933 [Elysia crispata]